MVKQRIMGELPLTEVHYMRKLLTLGDSVCRLRIGVEVMGTGFVLFGNYILTNAHLLKGVYVDTGSGNRLTVTVKAQFNYEDPSLKHRPVSFEADGLIYAMDSHMDYALLRLGSKPGRTVPPGLMKEFGPKPERGEVCIIGHPEGDVKTMDLTQIIEKNEQPKSVIENLQGCKGSENAIIMNKFKGQNIEELYSSDHEITYESSMPHGSSGSPLFDHEGRVMGLHSARFVYSPSKGPKDHSVIVFAHPILEILQNLVVSLGRRRDFSPEFIKEEAEGNPYVEMVLREAAAASRGIMDKPRAATEDLRVKDGSVHDEEIHHLLQKKFSGLREIPDESFQSIMEEGLGKSELPLNEVYYVKKLVGYGDSVCRLMIDGQPRGTGFVLFHRFILTNAHVLTGSYEGNGCWVELTAEVEAQFNYEDPSFEKPHDSFRVVGVFIGTDSDMDYALLWLKPGPGQTVPPGLLPHFGPKPERGEACIIGHHGGEVKRMDLTRIIEKNQREKSVNEKLQSYDESDRRNIQKELDNQKIKEMFNSDRYISYHTSMFAGSSGSPLFHAECRVVGLHSGGFPHSLSDKPEEQNVIEFARPVLEILESLLVKRFFSPGCISYYAGENKHMKSVLDALGK